MPESDVKRASFRFYMNRKEDKEIWDMLRNLEAVGYASLQEFANDAFLHYYKWLLERRVPYLRNEIEAEFKRWMQEVLSLEEICISRAGEDKADGYSSVETVKEAGKEIGKKAGEEPEAVEIEEDAINRAYDFLSTL